ncbi:MAG TPA: hypothetical protein VMN78_06150 [Longimicrobiales bacterium]|nr:hypothetical protein [Longimicrobiales bacterium]
MRNRMLMTVFALVLVPAVAQAQSEWLVEETGVALEVGHTSFEEDFGLSALSAGYFLSGRFQLPMGLAVVAELPFAYASYDFDPGFGTPVEGSDNTIGNVYLGVEMPVMLGAATVEAGLRLPTHDSDLDDFSPLVGSLAGAVDRYDAFLTDVITPRVGLQVGMAATELIGVAANLGAAYLIFTEDGVDDDFVLDGGLRAFVGPGATRLGAGLEGMAVLTGEGEFADRSVFQAGLWVDHDFGIVRPGVSLFLPLDEDYGEIISYVVGVSLQVSMP